MGGITVFHSGDLGYVPLKDFVSDVAFLPVGRMSPTASPDHAFKMAADIQPHVALAMHGSKNQKLGFQNKIQESMPQTCVLIMEQFTAKTLPLSNVAYKRKIKFSFSVLGLTVSMIELKKLIAVRLDSIHFWMMTKKLPF